MIPKTTVANDENWIEVGKLTWFYRETTPPGGTDRLPVVLLHGIVAQSYSWRGVMAELAQAGFRAIAPDWIGHGFSSQPDKRDFAYTPEAFLAALTDFLAALDLPRFYLVVQGFMGTVGLLYALQNPEAIERLVIINSPVTADAKLPWKMQQFGIPLVGDVLTQDPLLVDRTLEGGGPYQVDDADLDIYRRPFLRSSDAGRALLVTIRRLQLAETLATLEQGFQSWSVPTCLIWGILDPWLPVASAEQFVANLKTADLVKLDQVGHYAQEDWSERVSAALITFLKREVV